MAAKINVGLSKKVGESNYGSRGASVSLELDVDDVVVSDGARLRESIRRLYGVVRASLDEELHGGGDANSPPASHEQPASRDTEPSRNGWGSGNRPATRAQVKAIYAISHRQRADLPSLLRSRFNASRPDELSLREASRLIDELKGESSPQRTSA